MRAPEICAAGSGLGLGDQHALAVGSAGHRTEMLANEYIKARHLCWLPPNHAQTFSPQAINPQLPEIVRQILLVLATYLLQIKKVTSLFLECKFGMSVL